jgi:predicted MFS family arabinose efflux permease
VTGWWSAGLTATFAAVGFILLTLARSRGATPSAMGVMYALSAAGGVLGALATPRLMQRWTGRTLLRAAVWVDTAAALALLPTSSAYVMGGIGLAAFFLVPTVPAVLLGRLAVTCPDAIAGRAQAALTLIMGGFAPIAAPLAGVAVDRFGARVAVACCAGAFGLLGAAALLVLPSDDDTDARR